MPDEKKTPATKKFNVGGMWEEPEWLMQYNVEAEEQCPHVKDDICPRVVVVRNEGGYNSTGLCLDCILDAEKEGLL